jgi:hypothetical protein
MTIPPPPVVSFVTAQPGWRVLYEIYTRTGPNDDRVECQQKAVFVEEIVGWLTVTHYERANNPTGWEVHTSTKPCVVDSYADVEPINEWRGRRFKEGCVLAPGVAVPEDGYGEIVIEPDDEVIYFCKPLPGDYQRPKGSPQAESSR